jgi:hypothetical protein
LRRCFETGIGDTVGDSATRDEWNWSVPKRDLVSALQVLLQCGRFRCADVRGPEILQQELLNSRMKVRLETAHGSYRAWREGEHDDLVLATALACWHAKAAPGRISGGWSRFTRALLEERGGSRDGLWLRVGHGNMTCGRLAHRRVAPPRPRSPRGHGRGLRGVRSWLATDRRRASALGENIAGLTAGALSYGDELT